MVKLSIKKEKEEESPLVFSLREDNGDVDIMVERNGEKCLVGFFDSDGELNLNCGLPKSLGLKLDNDGHIETNKE
jgi:hypothetical protein